MHEAEGKGHHPAAIERRRDDVLDRHVNDGGGNQRLDQRREPRRRWGHVVCRRDERDRMRHGEGRDDDDERAETAKRNHQAQQEQQVIDATEDVEEPVHDESRRGLEPARVEPDEPRVAVELKCPLDALLQGTSSGRAGPEAKHCHRSQARGFESGRDRDSRLRRGHRVLEQHIHERLARDQLDVRGQRRAGHVRERALVGIERGIGRQREPRTRDAWAAQLAIALEQVHPAGDPSATGFEHRGLHLAEIEQRSFHRPLEIVDGGRERSADQQPEELSFRLKKRLDPDVAGDFVSRGTT